MSQRLRPEQHAPSFQTLSGWGREEGLAWGVSNSQGSPLKDLFQWFTSLLSPEGGQFCGIEKGWGGRGRKFLCLVNSSQGQKQPRAQGPNRPRQVSRVATATFSGQQV